MKNIYLVQANPVYGDKVKKTYIPYAAGCIASFAFSDERIKKEYRLGKFIYTRMNIKGAAESMREPFLAGFSTSVWNSEYNKALSAEVKKRYPECITVFGGHQLPPDENRLFSEFPDCDIAVHGGGEEAFRDILLALSEGKELSEIDNISVKTENGFVGGKRVNPSLSDYPSPYLEGIFDSLTDDPIEFSAILETNRGCPNRCAFCDWGALKSKVRFFDINRIYKEIEWISEHKIEYVYCADANFGLFDRDMDITNKFIELKNKTGFPKKIRVSFAKSRCDFVGEISKKLSENDMGKSQTLSFQSLDKNALEIVGRKNISLDYYRRLLRFYNKVGIPTYSELILGLPGETYESFIDGLCALIENGQHKSISIYPCELLPNSRLGAPDFREKYKIKTTKFPFRQYHCEKDALEEITEYSNIITETFSMSREDWINAYFFAVLVLSFHCLDITRETAVYMRKIHSVGYKEFYFSLMNFAFSRPSSYLEKIFSEVKEHLRKALLTASPICFYDGRFGNIAYEPDEYMFLRCVYDSKELYKAISEFALSLKSDDPVLPSLVEYQECILNLPEKEDFSAVFPYDFTKLFAESGENIKDAPQKRETLIEFKSPKKTALWKEYGTECVWYGRRRDSIRMRDRSAVSVSGGPRVDRIAAKKADKEALA